MSRPPDLVQGTLDLLLLKILALEPMNGHAIGQRLQQVSGDILKVSDGSLYPALHKLEQEGWLVATWKVTEKKRRAKYYALSRSGRTRLARETESWTRLSAGIAAANDVPGVSTVMSRTPADTPSSTALTHGHQP